MSKKQLNEYIIMPQFNEAAIGKIKADCPGISRQDLLDSMNKLQQQQLADLRGPVTDLVKKEGGEVLIDGSGFAIKDHPDQHASFMLVKATAKTADKIAKKTGALVGLNSTFHTC